MLEGPNGSKGVRLLNMQRLYDPHTAEALVPAYLNPEESDDGSVLRDMHRSNIVLERLRAYNKQMWRVELHLLCLSIRPDYHQLWLRCGTA